MLLRHLVLLLCLVPVGLVGQRAVPQVPGELTWCGVKLRLTPAAQAKVQTYVDRLHAKPQYFNALASKAAIFLPHIRHGLRTAGVPEDLQYVVIQESGLQGDAVSTSNAVGFWQFKDFTAREVGLLVDEHIDERKHISRATAGAARYFYRNNLWFNNWVYATIAYMTGPTGALPFVSPMYYGASEMLVDADLHWYAIKSIGYKVAFEQTLNALEPPIHLVAHNGGTNLSLADICKEHKVTAADVRQYNLWFTGWRVTSQRPMTYFVPAAKPDFAADPHLAQLFPKLDPNPAYAYATPPPKAPAQAAPSIAPSDRTGTASTAQKPVTLASHRNKTISKKPIGAEPLLDQEFTYVRAGETLMQLSARTEVRLNRIVRYNDLGQGEELTPGTPILLVPPRKATVHIALGKETLAQIAVWYERRAAQLAVLNDIMELHTVLPRGLRVHLEERIVAGTPPVIYDLDPPAKPSAQPTPQQAAPPVLTAPVVASSDKPGAGAAPRDSLITPAPASPPPGSAAGTSGGPKVGASVAGTATGATAAAAGQAQNAAAPPRSVPADHTAVVAAKPPAATPTPADSGGGTGVYQLYRVSRGDTLYGIARRFGMTASELRQVNGLAETEPLTEGDKLLVRAG